MSQHDEPTWRFGTNENGVVVGIFDRDTHEEVAVSHLTYDQALDVLRDFVEAANEWKRHYAPTDD